MELTFPESAAQPAENETSTQFSFEEFFDFSNEDDDAQLYSYNINADGIQSIKHESVTTDSSCNSSLGDFGSSVFTSDLCIPYDDLAELEWVSTFTEESFSSKDIEKLQFISGISSVRPDNPVSVLDTPTQKIMVPGKARSKRPRTAPGDWTSRLLLVSIPDNLKKLKKPRKYGTQCVPVAGRRCLHCNTDKTPQWRTGPMGPKTLCNACGVRYKSGRLVPEYRPASSPTFKPTEHSNSHRKVLELKKERSVLWEWKPITN